MTAALAIAALSVGWATREVVHARRFRAQRESMLASWNDAVSRAIGDVRTCNELLRRAA